MTSSWWGERSREPAHFDSATKSILCGIYGVRRQAKRDAALEPARGTESTKAPSPLRSSKKLLSQHSIPKRLMQAGVSFNNEPLPEVGAAGALQIVVHSRCIQTLAPPGKLTCRLWIR